MKKGTDFSSVPFLFLALSRLQRTPDCRLQVVGLSPVVVKRLHAEAIIRRKLFRRGVGLAERLARLASAGLKQLGCADIVAANDDALLKC